MTKPSPAPDVPEELPVLPLREFVIFPYMVLPLFVARDSSVAAVDDALASHRMLLLVSQRDPAIQAPEPDDLYRVGTLQVSKAQIGRRKVGSSQSGAHQSNTMPIHPTKASL